MTTTIITIILAIVAAAMVFLAYQERQRVYATKISVQIIRSVLRDCSALLDNPNVSMDLKTFISHVGTMALSNEFLYQFGKAPGLFSLTDEEVAAQKRAGDKSPYESMSHAEREMVKPVITKLMLASFAFSPIHARAIKYMVEADMIESVTNELLKPDAGADNVKKECEARKPRADEVAELRRQVPRIEPLLVTELMPA